MTPMNAQPTAPKNELLRELVIVTACVAMLLTGVGALYWMQTRPDEATAGTTTTGTATPTAAKAGETKPTESARPKVSVPAPDGAVSHTDVYFDFKSTRLRADAAKMLQDKAAEMTHTETWAVLVTGYADVHGPAAYNKVLAQRRADTVKQFLVELGVPETLVKAVALGPEAALCDDPSKECQQLNRRVHLEIRRLVSASAASSLPVAVAAPAAPKSPRADEIAQP
jgi:peptidoglycan-associated lipoprotein